MNRILFYDTETSGLPDWKSPSESENQPHIVQLGAILADAETREIISTMDVIIKPNGWVIPEEVSQVHGITTEKAIEVGIDEKEALETFLLMWDGCYRAAHNKTFDQRIIRIALKRFGTDEQCEAWANKDDHYCTMQAAKPVMQMGPKGRYGYKPPKLSEACEYFTGKPLENAHTAMADARACMEVYWALQDIEKNAA
jgi:DNA polymerase-3 subunit epsilon